MAATQHTMVLSDEGFCFECISLQNRFLVMLILVIMMRGCFKGLMADFFKAENGGRVSSEFPKRRKFEKKYIIYM